MAGKYSAGAIIAAMPFKGSKGDMADSGGDTVEKPAVCKISPAELEKLNNGEQASFTDPDGKTMPLEVGDEEESTTNPADEDEIHAGEE